MKEGKGKPAFAPRVSAVRPTGSSEKGLGNGSFGLQIDLPFSKQTGDWYWHWNAGLTWLDRARATFQRDDLVITQVHWLASPFLAGSGIYRLRPMFNLMLEALAEIGQTTTISPGFRRAWNVGDKQIVVFDHRQQPADEDPVSRRDGLAKALDPLRRRAVPRVLQLSVVETIARKGVRQPMLHKPAKRADRIRRGRVGYVHRRSA